jgi:acyl-CoA synthetase (AMP-forming)/AMP-acid ligase II
LAGAILRAAAERLAYYKLPGYFAFVDSLPVTATQKPRYGVLAELARSLLEEPSPSLHDVRQAKRNHGPARI